MSEDFDQYLLLAKEFHEIDSELQYVTKLVDEAQKRLDAETLSRLRQYIAILLQKMGELYSKKSAIEQRLNKNKPKILRKIDNAKEFIDRIKSSLLAISTGQLNLRTLWSMIRNARDTIIKLSNDLKESLEVIRNLQSKYQDELARHLRELASSAEKSLKVLNSLLNVLAIDPASMLRFKKMVGQNVRLEPGGEYAIITDVYTSIEGQVFLEVSLEEEIDGAALDSLYKDLGFDFMATDISDFRAKFTRRMQTRIGKQELKPSSIKHFLSVEGYLSYLSPETLSKLQPKYRPLGYTNPENLREQGGVLVAEKALLKEPPKDLVRCPSIKVLPEAIIGTTINIEDKYFRAVAQTFLPGLGRVIICIQQDKNGEPIPHTKLLENIFLYLSRHKDLSQDERNQISQALKILRSGKHLEEAYWRLRIMIARSGISSEITESSALRPINVFLYCLQKGVPLLLSEVYAYYLYVIETDNIEVSGRNFRYRSHKEPYAFSDVFDPKKLKHLLGLEFHEFLGVLVEKERVTLLCCPKIEREFWERIRAEYNLPSELTESVSKFLKALIFLKKFRSISDYYGMLDRFNVSRLIYSELVKEFDNDEFIIAHTHILRLVEELIKEVAGA